MFHVQSVSNAGGTVDRNTRKRSLQPKVACNWTKSALRSCQVHIEHNPSTPSSAEMQLLVSVSQVQHLTYRHRDPDILLTGFDLARKAVTGTFETRRRPREPGTSLHSLTHGQLYGHVPMPKLPCRHPSHAVPPFPLPIAPTCFHRPLLS